MAQVNFYIQKRPLASGAVGIYLSFAFDGHRLYCYTGQSIKDARHWVYYRDGKDGTRKKVQRVKSTAPGAVSLNGYLDDLEQKVLDIYRKGLQDGKTLSAGFILDELKKAKGKGIPTVLEAFDTFIEAKRFDNTEGYIKRLKVIRHDLETFSKEKKIRLDFNGFTDSFFLKLNRYYLDDLGNQSNTILTKQKILRRFLIWAAKPPRKYIKDQNFREEKLMKERPSNRFALLEDEVLALARLDLADPGMQVVRDIFVFSCYCGMRISDIKLLRTSNIFDDRIEYYSKKTDMHVVIPLVPFTRRLVHMYKARARENGIVFPVAFTDQHINRVLKKVAEMAGLSRIIPQHKNLPTGRVALDDKAVFQEVKMHISRHTFKTLCQTRGLNPIVQDAVMGHARKGVSEGYGHAGKNVKFIIDEYQRVMGDLMPEPINN